MQLHAVRELAERRQWPLEMFFNDDGCSGASKTRPGFHKLMAAARRRQFDVLIVYRSDRLFRSVIDLLQTLDELTALGIDFISVHEAWDSTTPMGRAMMTVAGAFAEFERASLRQRTRDGVAAARRRGETLGRPKRTLDALRILELRGRGWSADRIARELGVGRATLYRFAATDDRLKNVFAGDA